MGEDHLLHHGRAENFGILQTAPIKKGLGEDRQIVGRGKKAGMAGEAAHTTCQGIVNFSVLNFDGRSQA